MFSRFVKKKKKFRFETTTNTHMTTFSNFQYDLEYPVISMKVNALTLPYNNVNEPPSNYNGQYCTSLCQVRGCHQCLKTDLDGDCGPFGKCAIPGKCKEEEMQIYLTPDNDIGRKGKGQGFYRTYYVPTTVCGIPDRAGFVTFGQTCIGEVTDWSSTSKSKTDRSGSVDLKVQYPGFAKFDGNNQALQSWMSAVQLQNQFMINGLPKQEVLDPLLFRTKITGWVRTILDQVNSFGYFKDHPEQNTFVGSNFLSSSSQSWNEFVEDVFQDDSSTLQQHVKSTLHLPKSSNNSQGLIFCLTPDQKKACESSSGILTDILDALLDDKSLIVKKNDTTMGPYSPPEFNTDLAFEAFVFDFSSSTVKSSKELPAPTKDNFLICWKVTATIKQWSPMLLLYCKMLWTLPTDVCQSIQISPPFTKLVTCYQQTLSDIQDFCGYTIILPPAFQGVRYWENFMTQSSDMCTCFQNNLVPPTIRSEEATKASICFDSGCSQQQRSLYGITKPSDCQKYCATVWDWYTNPFPPLSSKRPNMIDKNLFLSVCGRQVHAFQPPTFNKTLLIGGVILTVLLTLLVGNHKEKKITLRIMIFLLLLATTFGVSWQMSGLSTCDENKGSVCVTKKGNMLIPTEFCSEAKLACECIKDEDCVSAGCSCMNTTCLPNNGRRTIQQEKNPRGKFSWTILILAILIATLLALLTKKYGTVQNKTNKLILYITLTVAPLTLPLVLLILPDYKFSFKKQC